MTLTLTPTHTLDDRTVSLQSRYLIPRDAPIHRGRRCDRHIRWELGGWRGLPPPILCSKTAQLIDAYLRAQRMVYHYHADLGIFYTLLSVKEEHLLAEEPYHCEMYAVPPKHIADALADAEK